MIVDRRIIEDEAETVYDQTSLRVVRSKHYPTMLRVEAKVYTPAGWGWCVLTMLRAADVRELERFSEQLQDTATELVGAAYEITKEATAAVLNDIPDHRIIRQQRSRRVGVEA